MKTLINPKPYYEMMNLLKSDDFRSSYIDDVSHGIKHPASNLKVDSNILVFDIYI